MTRFSLPGTLGCAVLIGAATLAAATEFVPDAGAKNAPRISGTMWVEEGPGYAVRLQKIGESDRRTYIERVTGSPADPFASRPDSDPRFTTFLVEIENRGDGKLVFQPKNCWLMTNRQQVLHPIGMEVLKADFGVLGEDMAPAYDRAGSAVLADSQLISGGRSVSGLLVYRSMHARTKAFHVDVSFLTSSGDLVKLSAPYKRLKEKKAKKEKP